jgi:predicted NBD/HSP70 family sugar kinase
LNEQIEREQAEAVRRIQDTFADVERRQVEQLKRSVDREVQRLAEAAAQQFDAAIKIAREDAARRLSRELDRAVAVFSREADSVLGERLSQVADAGVQHLEKRLRQIAAGLERQRDEFVEALERRLGDAEAILRDRVEAVTAEGRVEHDVLDARLRELSARIEETAARARSRLAAYE